AIFSDLGGPWQSPRFCKLSYKRGYQGKNSPPPLRGNMDVVACIQPYLGRGGVWVLATRPTQLVVSTRRFHDAIVLDAFSAPEATQASSVGLSANHDPETRGPTAFWGRTRGHRIETETRC